VQGTKLQILANNFALIHDADIVKLSRWLSKLPATGPDREPSNFHGCKDTLFRIQDSNFGHEKKTEPGRELRALLASIESEPKYGNFHLFSPHQPVVANGNLHRNHDPAASIWIFVWAFFVETFNESQNCMQLAGVLIFPKGSRHASLALSPDAFENRDQQKS
jgi:hypothetical protein